MTRGAYILIMDLDGEYTISIGSLGEIRFCKGTYAYTGSAMGGLEARLRRHFSKEKKFWWHIDHLLEKGRAVEAFYLPSDRKVECLLNKLVSLLPGSVPIKGFGASDCHCGTHLQLISDEGHNKLLDMFNGLRFDPDDLLHDE